jgi:hypothetical protein
MYGERGVRADTIARAGRRRGSTRPDSERLGGEAAQAERAVHVQLLRDIFGNPFRPLPVIDPSWLAWDGGTVRNLARIVYAERHLPEGILDSGHLAVLADALEEAGCAETDILGHLRGLGLHVRGCWALDLLLGKE